MKPILIGLALALLAGAAGMRVALAQGDFPAKPVRIVVAFPAGGSNDMVARLLGQKISENIHQPVVVDNRPGAAGMIGTDFVVKSAPDGYTIMIISDSLVVNPLLNPNIKFDVRQSLAPVTLLANMTYVLLVNPAVAARDLGELVKLAKSRPGKLNYSSTGIGSTGQILMESFNRAAGVDIMHVPYKGGNTATLAVFTNDAQVSVISVATSLPFAKAGKIRVLALLGSARDKALPEIPTLSELGYSEFRTPWLGIFAPARTSPPILQRLRNEFLKAMNMPDTREKLESQGFELVGSTPTDFTKFIEDNVVFYEKLIREAGLKAE